MHLASLTPDNPVALTTCRVIRSDGTPRSVRWNSRAFFDSNGEVREYQFVGYEED
jgi:hypothetical protein